MEPIDKWMGGIGDSHVSVDPATGTYYTYTIEWKTFNYSPWMSKEEEEKVPTFNEPRLKPIKP